MRQYSLSKNEMLGVNLTSTCLSSTFSHFMKKKSKCALTRLKSVACHDLCKSKKMQIVDNFLDKSATADIFLYNSFFSKKK